MESAALLSPSSDESIWISLRDRIDCILDNREPNQSTFKEDSLLLIKGLDSVSSSVLQLTDALWAAQQGLNDLAKPSLRKSLKRESQRTSDEEDEHRKAKKRCGPHLVEAAEDSKEEAISADHKGDLEEKQNSIDVTESVNLNKAKNLAVAVVSKAASLAKELKIIRSELHSMQERCSLLEEENRRFRDNFEKGSMPDEDDMVRVELEAHLAEKSRLAKENGNLVRENRFLHELVEYYQLIFENSTTPLYEEEIGGAPLEVSSTEQKAVGESDDVENINADGEHPGSSNITINSSSSVELSKEVEEEGENRATAA
ncbi:uncharacterized protein LOC110020448 isoform X2 [Phalaenopsis equestris]|uniref:uncharacterized protein LOC110020448 isoform X2 n=1 Tax=Phalaenopsis equestris TaxID=78828 RepID=UPI0009E4FA02|nr:uncharacterized protein LOC110020448 isoform X2 [Phalaenopsis equestris]